MGKNLNNANERRGAWGEFHVNSTLHSMLDAVRYRNETVVGNNSFLFDNIYLPSSYNPKIPYTEADHVLVSKKGVFVIETKTVLGRILGERKGDSWFTVAQDDRGYRNNLRSRTMEKNPFKQNYKHIKAVEELLNFKRVKGVVILVEADYDGWLEGDWHGEDIEDLFLSAEIFANHVLSLPDSLSNEQVLNFSRALNKYYLMKDELEPIFFAQFNH